MTAPIDTSSDTMYATFTTPMGDVVPLTDTTGVGTDAERGWFTTREIAGWGARPYEFVVDALPRGGDTVRFIRAESARITWQLHIWGNDHTEFVERYRTIRRAIMSTVHRRKPGQLTVWRPDGSSRVIDVYYEMGFAGESGENWYSANPVITFLAPDGYWRDTEPTKIVREYAPGSSFYNPFPSISSSQVFGSTTLINPGEVDAWPTWTITGPAESLTATNNSTGQSFILTYPITAGQTITITTLRPTVRGPAGQNLVNAINWPTAELWALLPGNNDIVFAVGAGSAGTKIELEFYARHEGA